MIGAFLFLLAAPILDKIIHLHPAPQPKENRILSHRPPLGDLQFGHLQEFLAGNESWFNDHFGLRNQLIGWSHEWRHEIYHDGDRDFATSRCSPNGTAKISYDYPFKQGRGDLVTERRAITLDRQCLEGFVGGQEPEELLGLFRSEFHFEMPNWSRLAFTHSKAVS